MSSVCTVLHGKSKYHASGTSEYCGRLHARERNRRAGCILMHKCALCQIVSQPQSFRDGSRSERRDGRIGCMIRIILERTLTKKLRCIFEAVNFRKLDYSDFNILSKFYGVKSQKNENSALREMFGITIYFIEM